MYKFVEALNDDTYTYLRKKFGYAESSDISPIVGWILDEKQVEELIQITELTFKVFDIPEKFQDDITGFKTQYWDGDFYFEKNQYSFIKEK